MIERVKSVAKVMRMKKEQGDANFVLMLGAGASITSGVPSAATIMSELLNEYGQDIAIGSVEQRFDQLWKRTSDNIRGGFLARYLTDRPPSTGYQKLAELIRAGYFDVVLTFNFDNLLESALKNAGLAEFRRVLRGETMDDEMYKLVESREPRVKLVKLHGSLTSTGYFLFDATEMHRYPEPIESLLRNTTSRDIVVCGYSFNDMCVIRAFADQGGTIVCVNPGGVPRNLAGFLRGRRSEDQEIRGGFDEFFTMLHRELLQPAVPEERPPANPFKFLESYDSDDGTFAGRNGEIDDFFNYLDWPLRPPRVVVITGPGRAGKTSLVRAGLMPRLQPEKHHGIYLRCQADICTSVPSGLAALGEVPTGLLLPDALTQLAAKHEGRRVLLFLDQFERVANTSDRLTREGAQKLSHSMAPLLTSPATENITLILVVTDEATLGATLIQECSRSQIPAAMLVCQAFSRADIITIMQSIADNAGFEFEPRIIQDLAETFEKTRNNPSPETRFTLAHVHAICHLLARTKRVTYVTYKTMFDGGNLEALHDAINVCEFASFVEDRSWPSSAWLRNMLKVPLQESKERIARYIKSHYEDIVPPDTRPAPRRVAV